MYDERFESDDPHAGYTPWLRRPVVRMVVTLIAVGTFLLTTLISSCGPRHRVPEPPATTIPTVEVGNPLPPGGLLITGA